MRIEITNQRDNPLFKRKEVLAKVDYEGKATPSKADLQVALAHLAKANAEHVEIGKMMSLVGKSSGVLSARIWETKPPEKKKKSKEAAAPAK